MWQFFMFFVTFLSFCLISLVLKFLKNDEGLLREKFTCYDHFMSYIFWYYKLKQTNKLILIFSSFLKIFVIF